MPADEELTFTPHAGPDAQVSTTGALASADNPEPYQKLALFSFERPAELFAGGCRNPFRVPDLIGAVAKW